YNVKVLSLEIAKFIVGHQQIEIQVSPIFFFLAVLKFLDLLIRLKEKRNKRTHPGYFPEFWMMNGFLQPGNIRYRNTLVGFHFGNRFKCTKKDNNILRSVAVRSVARPNRFYFRVNRLIP